MQGMGVPYLNFVPRVGLRHVAGWLVLLHQGTMAMHSSQSRGRDSSPILPLCHDGWIDVADMRALAPLVVSEALCGFGWRKGQGA
jgi:hypothetical protein